MNRSVFTNLQFPAAGGPPRRQPATWFSKLFGFHEMNPELGVDPDWVRSQVEFSESDMKLKCPSNGKEYKCGAFSAPSVHDLRGRLQQASTPPSSGSVLTFQNIVADVRDLLHDPLNSDAVFQAASQFNCLEMVHSYVTPEEGIDGYAADRTQGPICAVACAAGTFYRNYFIRMPFSSAAHDSLPSAFDGAGGGAGGGGGGGQPGPGAVGQSKDLQLNMMQDVEVVLNNAEHRYWQMRNGYLLPVDDTSLERLYTSNMLTQKREECLAALRVGIQHDTQVTSNDLIHTVTQVYASAVPVGYDKVTPPVTKTGVRKAALWQPLAQLVLDATYEACLAVAALQSIASGKRVTCYLTKVGGGVFQNSDEWIVAAIRRAIGIHHGAAIDVKVVHYGCLQEEYLHIAARKELFVPCV